eukprot:scaffold12231_cov103-Isochrysis_galbana.AAC.5
MVGSCVLTPVAEAREQPSRRRRLAYSWSGAKAGVRRAARARPTRTTRAPAVPGRGCRRPIGAGPHRLAIRRVERRDPAQRVLLKNTTLVGEFVEQGRDCGRVRGCDHRAKRKAKA